jgi:redox-sensitive bicupin YhaK (pirin superfamily)
MNVARNAGRRALVLRATMTNKLLPPTPGAPPRRRIDRVRGVVELGADGQVDRKAIVLPAGDFERSDPFLMLAEDWFSRPGFDWHPHRGIETVTVVLDGALEHGDSRGNAGVLGPGDVQWMTAGSGIVHRELAHRDEHVHTLQLWVNLPSTSKMVEARYQDFTPASMARREGSGSSVLAVSGSLGDGLRGPAENHWPVTGLQIVVEPGAAVTVPLPAEDRAFLYLQSGAVAVGDPPVRIDAGQVAWSDPLGAGDGGSVLELHAPGSGPNADEPARLVLFSGRPIGEQVVARGPFVMNTEREIIEAFADFRSGGFGPIPRLARVT